MIIKSRYLTTKIYNNNLTSAHLPTFSFVSRKPGFGIKDVEKAVIKKSCKYFMILINGQQIATLESNMESDRLFGQPFTGIHRMQEKGFWKGRCRIYVKNKLLSSTATELEYLYGSSAIILDVLNPKYDWQNHQDENQTALKYIGKLVLEIINLCKLGKKEFPHFFIAGYSRGGIFALKLTDFLKEFVKINALVTLDPVISEISESDSMCIGWGIKRKNNWTIEWEKKISGIHLGADSFPIIRNPGVPCYNVFQRKAFFALNSILEKPIGSAVENAFSPMQDGYTYHSPSIKTPFSQFNLDLTRHSEILERYSSWVIKIAKNRCPI